MSEHPNGEGCNPPIQQRIDEQGFFVANLQSGDACPAFSYTIGLRDTEDHPDFLAMGLSLEMNSYLVVTAAERIQKGERFEFDKDYDGFIDGFPVRFVKVLREHTPRHFGFGYRHYDADEFDAFQIVWPDKQGNWPWEEDYPSDLHFYQKLLDRDPGFAFYAPKNLRTFCSRQIFDSDKLITDAIHGEDGDWQFITDDPCSSENIMLVCLEEIVKKDATINELFDLPRGKRAIRESLDGEWTIEDYHEEE